MKKVYLIQYKLVDASPILETRMKAQGAWIRFFENSWLLESSLSSQDLYSKLSIDFKDLNILIIEVKAENYFGRMNTNVWEYLKARK